MDEFYNVNQTAIILKVHPLTVRRYVKEGRLKAIKVGGNIRISKQAISQFGENIYPTTFKVRQVQRDEKTPEFDLDDPLFRLKGRGLSIKSID